VLASAVGLAWWGIRRLNAARRESQ
jgi:hypothetical protein